MFLHFAKMFILLNILIRYAKLNNLMLFDLFSGFFLLLFFKLKKITFNYSNNVVVYFIFPIKNSYFLISFDVLFFRFQ